MPPQFSKIIFKMIFLSVPSLVRCWENSLLKLSGALFGLIAGILLPILRKWLKKMQRRCHRGHAEQETGIEMREIGADVGGGERGQENA